MLPSNVDLANPIGFLWGLYLARWQSPSSFWQNQSPQTAMVRIESVCKWMRRDGPLKPKHVLVTTRQYAFGKMP
jgi:hypothetical protein